MSVAAIKSDYSGRAMKGGSPKAVIPQGTSPHYWEPQWPCSWGQNQRDALWGHRPRWGPIRLVPRSTYSLRPVWAPHQGDGGMARFDESDELQLEPEDE